MLTCIVALHTLSLTLTYRQTTCMKSDRDYLSFCCYCSLNSPSANNLLNTIQKQIHHCTMAVEHVNHWVYPSNQEFYASNSAVWTCVVTEYKQINLLHQCACQLNTALLLCFRGNAYGQRITCISRNQTLLPVALMLMTMLWNSRGNVTHLAFAWTMQWKSQLFSLSVPVREPENGCPSAECPVLTSHPLPTCLATATCKCSFFHLHNVDVTNGDHTFLSKDELSL